MPCPSLIRHQYGKPADMESLMARIGPGVPGSFPFCGPVTS